MKPTEQTKQQTERFLRKTAEKIPSGGESDIMTDIHIRVNQETGDIMSFDDDGNEITRAVIESWIGNTEENFYDDVAAFLRSELKCCHELADGMGIIKPYSFVLEDENGSDCKELYVADDDTIIIGGDLMKGLDADLDAFYKTLMEE